ncbi:MAG: polyprenyl synthetase family protein [Candidatus Marinimicrobia bacterium]|nr:polyprenyl synthetase family protein [Candidatus Neomarinimicrobiota bacterium]
MKVRLSDIASPILDDLKLFQKEFENALRSEVRLVNTMVRYVLRNRGKRLRPILTILSARISGQPSLDSMKAAALVEIIHIATLIHDDVVDESNLRRGWPSIKRVFNNKKAVLIGDYFLSKALSNMISLRNFKALETLSSTAERLSSGEILQLEKALMGGMSEKVYYQMIKDKTASLFATACELGALTASDNQEHWTAMRTFGENLGIAFQIKDDLFDLLGDKATLGKPVSFDVKRNKRTLPLLYALKQMSPMERRKYLWALKRHGSRGDLARLRRLIEDSGGIDYAEGQIVHFGNKALETLRIFPPSTYKDSLTDIVRFNAQRAW